MHIIPVIDLLAGQVVRAIGGERQRYRPIVSVLCRSADPKIVAPRLCAHCATDTLYIADLDALQGAAIQTAALAALLDRLVHERPSLCLWLDAGFSDLDAALALREALGPLGAHLRPVFGSESLRSVTQLERLQREWPQAVLSLDSRHGRAIDVSGLWQAPALWPEHVIAMGLERVGSGAGPDLQHFAALRARAPGRRWIGSGGLRDDDDRRAAAHHGAWAWLVASALHDGGLAPQATVGGAQNVGIDAGIDGDPDADDVTHCAEPRAASDTVSRR